MDANRSEGSQNLRNLAEQLRLCRSSHNLSYSDINNDPIEDLGILKSGGLVIPLEEGTEKANSNRAAVLICLFEGVEGDLRVILTKRSSRLSSDPGEVALPGGKVEEGDSSYVETALREANEEIGLDPSLVDVVTSLESFTTKRGISVVPVIGIMHDKAAFHPVANAAEVEAIFDAPLEMFLKDENRREMELEWMGQKYLLHFFDHQAENHKFVIWALTAGILIRAASLVFQRQPSFEERRPNFWHKSGL